MYTREIQAPIASPIQDGVPLFGTWNRAFEKVDLQEIHRPFRYPVPRWVKGLRIKEWECFSAHDDKFALEALFCNVKFYRMAQVLLYDKENDKKFLFRKIKPGTGWHLPQNLANASVDGYSSHFYFRIHSWLDAGTIRLDINVEATRRHPSLTIHLAYNVSSQDVTPMAVSLGITGQRSMYAYKALAPVRGDMVLGGRHIGLKQDTCSGFFCDYKGYFPYRMHTTICSAIGFDEENRRFGFNIAENQTRETNKNNENALWVNGQLTPLPPVLITQPGGPEAGWVIQDVEGMVDLTFTPKEQNKNGMNLIFTHAELNFPMGYYNGMLMNSEGKKIQIKNIFGIGEKLYLRV
ncbi:MAG: DUF2804 domain-containing protein [Treponema sp.]|jgi:hypothetical protein|nr:DUF2804 domain-containing protein [Treponema sp.]